MAKNSEKMSQEEKWRREDEEDARLMAENDAYWKKKTNLKNAYIKELEKIKKQVGFPNYQEREGHVIIDKKVEVDDEMIDEVNRLIHENFLDKLTDDERTILVIELNEEEVANMHFTPIVLAQLAWYYTLHPAHKVATNLEWWWSKNKDFFYDHIDVLEKLPIDDCYKFYNIFIDKDDLSESDMELMISSLYEPDDYDFENLYIKEMPLRYGMTKVEKDLLNVPNYNKWRRIDRNNGITTFSHRFDSKINNKTNEEHGIKLFRKIIENGEDWQQIINLPPITKEHILVSHAIGTIYRYELLNDKQRTMSYRDIALMCSFKDSNNASTKDVEKIVKIVDDLTSLKIAYIANNSSYLFKKGLKKAELRKPFLHANEIRLTASNGQEVGGIEVLEIPVLFFYADQMHQMTTIPAELRKINPWTESSTLKDGETVKIRKKNTLSSQQRNLYVDLFLYLRSTQNKNSNMYRQEPKIAFDWICKVCGVDYSDKNKKMLRSKKYKQCEELLQFLKDKKFIKDFKRKKDHFWVQNYAKPKIFS